MSSYGAGYHAWEISKEKYYRWLKVFAALRRIGNIAERFIQWFYISTVIYCPAAFFTKTTILLLIARIFTAQRRYSRAIYAFIWASLAAYIPMEIVRISVCQPIRTFWDPLVQNGRCLNQRKVFFSSLALAIVTDVIILLVPVPLVYKLNQPVKEKLKILLLLAIGGLATGATCFRVRKVVDFLNSDDITIDYTPIGILMYVKS